LAETARVDVEVVRQLEARFRRPSIDEQRHIRKALEDGGVASVIEPLQGAGRSGRISRAM
jgi:hypothetical protein